LAKKKPRSANGRWLATITSCARTTPRVVRTMLGVPSSTANAVVSSKIVPPSLEKRVASPRRYLRGWNSAWRSSLTAPSTGYGSVVSVTKAAGSPTRSHASASRRTASESSPAAA
jgi:hypothetical protein